ncbi:hypothetical protein [uncultured Alistipes sp.]|uniref:hypothetical protein n=1 Tax=uncultured Alistipes sp. TaxID=538949 RepID=UPI0025CF6927|nr:hypothetical protein [uncultured Alistipes sp.]
MREDGNGDEFVVGARRGVHLVAAVPPDQESEPGEDAENHEDEDEGHLAAAAEEPVVDGRHEDGDGDQQVEDGQQGVEPAEWLAEKRAFVDERQRALHKGGEQIVHSGGF